MDERVIPGKARPAAQAWRAAGGLLRRVPFVSGRALFEAALIGSVYVVYIAIRGMVSGREAEALTRGIDVVDIEQWLRVYHEESLQNALLNWEPGIVFLNVMYFAGHFPPLLAFAFWIYRTDRRKYTLVRSTFLLSAFIGLAIYWAIPTAPPRLLPASFGFVDTLHEFGPFSAYDVQGNDPFVNEYAAIPSLHFGWAALLAVGFAWSVSWRWYGLAAAILWPAITVVIIAGTANHFFIDAAIGALVVLVAFVAAQWLQRRYRDRLGDFI